LQMESNAIDCWHSIAITNSQVFDFKQHVF
jgi:hypothetical protein